MSTRPVGIHAIGSYLPEPVRTNDWWPDEVVNSWKSNRQKDLAGNIFESTDPKTPGAQITLAAMAQFSGDPFKGAIERRVMPPGMVSSDMEIQAARVAIDKSGVDVDDIGLLLTSSQLPDYLIIPTATHVHRSLGLPERCLSMGTD